MPFQSSDDVNAVMNGSDPLDPNTPAGIKRRLFAVWSTFYGNGPSATDNADNSLQGAGDAGMNNGGSAQPKPVSSDPAEPKPASQPINLVRADHVPNSQQPSNDAQLKTLAKSLIASGAPISGSTQDLESHIGLPVGMPRAEDAAEPGSIEDLENRAAESTPGMFAAAARAQKPTGVLGVLSAIGKQVMPRLGNMGYALSGHDPREMALREQAEQFEEEMQREKMSPDYIRQVAEAQAEPKMVTSPNANDNGYTYETVDPFSGRATPTGITAPTPEKSPAQVLAEFVQRNPDALIKGTPANQKYEELAEGMRAFPSQQAQIRANAEMYVGRMGVQRAVVQANGLIRAMQGRNISDNGKMQASAIQAQIEAAAHGWAEFYTQHPWLQMAGYGPDQDSQARFMADAMNQLSDIALETNQLTEKIPGAAPNVVPPLVHNAANSHSKRGTPLTEAEATEYLRRAGGDKNKARQLARQDGRTF